MRKSEKPSRVPVNLDSVNDLLTFVEQYLSFNSSIRPTLDKEFEEAGVSVPSRILAEVKVATRYLLTEPRTRRGKLMVVTGLGRAGKETQISNPSRFDRVTPLTDLLRGRGYNVATTATTYTGMIGGLLGLSLGRTDETLSAEGSLNEMAAWILWSLERAGRSGRLCEWMEKDQRNVLIAKGWTERSIAYGSVRGVEASRILEFERNILKPDYIVLLDASAETIRRRWETLPPAGVNLDELQSGVDAFRRLPKQYPIGSFYQLDANGSPAQVNASLRDLVASLFP